ncbi:hypothetical protein QN277_002292 [Acacia crassicarpa]|uniref:Uncharacterized protein n=1 Tax=Acacia crassicarpa TaxID=499986 RepID=A0AAE1THQ4_9FABA|nr:hypothetical protein QN277_002292 [Acacia crassicarpa]
MLLVYVILQNWFLGVFGLTENNRLFSLNDNFDSWLSLTTFLVILGFGWSLFLYFSETKQPNDTTSNNGNNEFQRLIHDLLEDEEREHSDQIGLGFIAVNEQPDAGEWTANNGGGHSDCACCAFCGDLSTTRCSRCKTARYCSDSCQIQHWRLVHKNECRETRTLVQQRLPNSQDEASSRIVHKPKKEGYNELAVVEWNPEVGGTHNAHNSTRKPAEASGEAPGNIFSCAVCGGSATTTCSRCKAVGYCSAKCLIEHWQWHKTECTPEDVDSAQTVRRPSGNVGLLKNSCEEDNDHSSHPLALEFYPEGTANSKPLIRGSQEPTKRAQDQTVDGVRCHKDEIAKFRNEITLLKAELDKWTKRANIAKEKYQSFKAESEHQLLVLRNENKRISNSEMQAQNAVHNLSQRLQDLQIAAQGSFAEEKKRQEEYVQKLERELRKEWEHVQELSAEKDERCKAAQIATRELEEKEKELQLERERVQLLKDDFRRDLAAAESRALIAEAKLLDLDRKNRSRNDKVAVWTDSLGRPAMACAICLTNEKDLAFGCGHMTCRDCGSQLTKCPICREQITSSVRLYPG